jgi:hypothetical protein
MVDSVSIVGGVGQASPLSAAEHQAAIQALAKIGANTLLSGGDKVASGSLDAGTARTQFRIVDTVPGGSAAKLNPEAIKQAGASAAAFKPETQAPGTGHTITMADKTTITVTGVPHNVVKPH